ncbi:two-component regulator propeller domain-containing protein [Limibacter armeniacum]|uniref:ligand-binding sensor domain-containing protein n=1 Tax=Limibacter armeniacum TaxID=466084 RepID=UPI002FE53E2B
MNTPSLLGQQHNLEIYDLENGLPQSEVTSVLKDSRGYIWTSTYGGGLSRFNGTSFKTFTKKDGLTSIRTCNIIEDHNQNIWITTLYGVFRYDGEEFYKIHTDKSFLHEYEQRFFIDKTNRLWLNSYATVHNFIGYIEGDSLKVYQPEDPYLQALLSKHKITPSAAYSEGAIVSFPTPEGLYELFEDGSLRLSSLHNLPEFKNSAIASISKVGHQFLIGTVGELFPYFGQSGQLFLSAGDGRFQEVVLSPKNREILEKSYVYQAENAPDGTMWLSCWAKGLAQISDGSFSHFITKKNGLPSNELFNFCFDHEGNLWVATIKGLVKYSGDLFTYFDQRSGINDTDIYSIYCDKKGNEWFGTWDGELYCYDGKKLAQKITMSQGLKTIFSIREDSVGNLLLACRTGAWRYNGKQVKNINAEKKLDGINKNKNICLDVLLDGENEWYSFSGEGIVCVNGQDTTWYRSYDANLAVNYERNFYKDNHNNLWVSGRNCLWKINPEGKTTAMHWEDGFSHPRIVQSTQDKLGRLWVATLGGGINILDISAEEATHVKVIDSNEGLASDQVFSLLTDKRGNIWAGTSLGVDKIILDENGAIKRIKHYDKNTGYKGIQSRWRSSTINQKGELLFGTIDGVMRFNPDKEYTNTTPPKVYITDVKLFHQQMDWKDEYNIQKSKWTNTPQELTLSHTQNHVSFAFEGLSFKVPGKVTYSWKLSGVDQDWTPPSAINNTTYTQLEPGDYTFEVKAANTDNIWSIHPAKFTFTIEAPYWQKSGFYLLVGTIATIVCILLVRTRVYINRKKQKELEDLIFEQTRKLFNANKKLQDSNKLIQAKRDEIIQSITYAEQIQKSTLPLQQHIEALLPNHFILYKPKAVVSGDFYFIEQVKDKTIVAAVDCTGHGVPGAFMSIIGSNLLNSIIRDRKITDSEIILDELNKGVMSTLKQHDNHSSDGMDISLCVIDHQENVIEFSGAKMGLCYWQHEHASFEFIRGSRRTIGGDAHTIEGCFQKHVIPLEGTTTFFLYSDGYQDQFGGERNTKFLSKRFRNLLMSIAHLPLYEQKNRLENILQKWMGKQEQVDDVMVLGFRLKK